MNTIQILNFKPLSKGTLQGFIDVFIPKMGIEVYGCALHEKQTKSWINFPCREVVEPTGEKKYYSYIRFRNRDQMDTFSSEVRKSLQDYLEKNIPNVENERVPF